MTREIEIRYKSDLPGCLPSWARKFIYALSVPATIELPEDMAKMLWFTNMITCIMMLQ